MNRSKKLFASALTSTIVFASSFALVFADEATIQGNGALSDNTIVIVESDTSVVDQSNSAFIGNSVGVSGNSGGNTANGNTGGDVGIQTGGVGSTVLVDNKANKNVAETSECCPDGNLDAKISGNGALSDNTIIVKDESESILSQENKAVIKNNVEVLGNSGENTAYGNTGPAENDPVKITTGGVEAIVGVQNKANLNVATGGDGCCPEGESNLEIKNNGFGSKNKIVEISMNLKLKLQSNWAFVANWVGVGGNTGGNTANGNTGGNVGISTGPFGALITLMTKLNKNIDP